jgi:hypothetical protein
MIVDPAQLELIHDSCPPRIIRNILNEHPPWLRHLEMVTTSACGIRKIQLRLQATFTAFDRASHLFED